VIVFAITQWDGHPDVVDSYGPNLFASFVELMIAAGLLQWWLDRLREAELAPPRRYVNRIARAILGNADSLVNAVVTVEQRDRQAPASRDRADAFADGLANFDPDARAVGVWPERTLREWTTTLVDEMQRRYEWSAEAVAVYGSDTLVDKLEAVMKDGVITFFRLVATERGTYGS
jgi:hypothetical protein